MRYKGRVRWKKEGGKRRGRERARKEGCRESERQRIRRAEMVRRKR